MIRGTSRRVIVVDSPDPQLFEQAIFIVRSDALHERGVSAQQLVGEACRVAKSYGRSRSPRLARLRGMAPLLYAALGALAIGAVWLLTVLL